MGLVSLSCKDLHSNKILSIWPVHTLFQMVHTVLVAIAFYASPH